MSLSPRVDQIESDIAVLQGGGGGSEAGLNYFLNGNFEADASNGVSVTNITSGAETTTPLFDDQSNKLTSTASVGTADYQITGIDNAVLEGGIVCSVTGYLKTDAAVAEGDWTVGVYNTTDAVYTTTQTDLKADTLNVHRTTFVPVTGKTYVLRVEFTDTTAARVLVVDRLTMTPEGSTGLGAVVTDWEDYVPTTSGFTFSSGTAEWRRVGSSIEIRAKYNPAGETGTEWQFGLPNGLTVSNTNSSTFMPCGKAIISTTSTTGFNYTLLATHGDTFLNVGKRDGVASVQPFDPLVETSIAPATMALYASVPVAEFAGSGTTNLISDDLAAANAKAFFSMDSGSTLSSGVNDVISDNYDIRSGFTYNAGTGDLTPLFTGTIRVDVGMRVAANQASVNYRITDGVNTKVVCSHNGASGVTQLRGSGTFEVTASVPINIASYSVGATTYAGTAGEDNYVDITRVADYSAGQPVGFGLATADTAGLLPYYSAETKTMDGSYTSGIISMTRIGNVVTLSLTEHIVFSTSSTPGTSDGFLPTKYRPAILASTNFGYTANRIFRLEVTTSGRVFVYIKDYSGVGQTDVNVASLGFTISYQVD